jgi:hypothetical protein
MSEIFMIFLIIAWFYDKLLQNLQYYLGRWEGGKVGRWEDRKIGR